MLCLFINGLMCVLFIFNVLFRFNNFNGFFIISSIKRPFLCQIWQIWQISVHCCVNLDILQLQSLCIWKFWKSLVCFDACFVLSYLFVKSLKFWFWRIDVGDMWWKVISTGKDRFGIGGMNNKLWQENVRSVGCNMLCFYWFSTVYFI